MFSRQFIWSCAVVCSAAVFAQVSAGQRDPEARANAAASILPVAYVYVSSTPTNSSVNEIVGFVAAANGKLTPLPGSPFNASVASMAVNGRYLFGSDTDALNIDAYRIELNGALSIANQTDVANFNSGDCGYAGPLFLDHTGQSLYVLDYRGDSCSNNEYQSLHVMKSKGALTNIGEGVVDNWLSQPAAFIGNNVYAYYVSCLGDMYWEVGGTQRSSSGLLSLLPNFSAPLPAPPAGDFWCPSVLATDRGNHVAIALQPVSGQTFNQDGGPQIGSFTAAGNGNLSTGNTQADMPVSAVVTALSMKISPSGRLLALGGTGGLQIFNFNGAAAPTVASGLLTTDEIDRMFWDNNQHLYAISKTAGTLHVYTVTQTRHVEAPGSPYDIMAPQDIVVQPSLLGQILAASGRANEKFSRTEALDRNQEWRGN